jgi:hypothetical protein
VSQQTIKNCLKNASQLWREIVMISYPLYGDMPLNIDVKDDKDQPSFQAYTNGKAIWIKIGQAVKWHNDLLNQIIPRYDNDFPLLYRLNKNKHIESFEKSYHLHIDNFIFVLFHELYHPLICPDSREDERAVNIALYEGIKEALPTIDESKILNKVNNCKNLVWDVVVNLNFLYRSESADIDHLKDNITYIFLKNNRNIKKIPIPLFPSGIIPMIYIISAENNTTDIPIAFIGLFYSYLSYNTIDVRDLSINVFMEALNRHGLNQQTIIKVLRHMFTGFFDEVTDKEIQIFERFHSRTFYLTLIDRFIHTIRNKKDSQTEAKNLLKIFINILNNEKLRYKALKGFIKALAPYISENTYQKQGSFDPDTSSDDSSGSDEQSDDESKNDQAGDEDKDQAGNNEDSDDDESGDDQSSNGQEDDKNKDQTENNENSEDDKSDQSKQRRADKKNEEELGKVLDDILSAFPSEESDKISEKIVKQSIEPLSLMVLDNYFKRNAEPIIFVKQDEGPPQSIEYSRIKEWKLASSELLTAEKVSCLNFNAIDIFQRNTGLPVLVNLNNGFFQLNEYIEVEKSIYSDIPISINVEIPDNWVLFVDSSGSMTRTTEYHANPEIPYHKLMRVVYGLMKGLNDICKTYDKNIQFGTVNFSTETRFKGLDSLINVFNSRIHEIKKNILIPQCGWTSLETNIIERILQKVGKKKSVLTIITDGELSNWQQVYHQLTQVSKLNYIVTVFIEIANESELGKQIKAKKTKGIEYQYVDQIEDIGKKLKNILVRYQ